MTGAIRIACKENGRVFIIEHVVPGPAEPHFSKLFDIQMMCWGTGRERTEDEYAELLQAAGWTHIGSWYPSERKIGIIEGGAVYRQGRGRGTPAARLLPEESRRSSNGLVRPMVRARD
jgi:hypothetical protein